MELLSLGYDNTTTSSIHCLSRSTTKQALEDIKLLCLDYCLRTLMRNTKELTTTPNQKRTRMSFKMKDDNDKKVRKLIILHFLYIIEGGLISEGILALVPLPTKGAKSLPVAEYLSFTPITVNNLLTPNT